MCLTRKREYHERDFRKASGSALHCSTAQEVSIPDTLIGQLISLSGSGARATDGFHVDAFRLWIATPVREKTADWELHFTNNLEEATRWLCLDPYLSLIPSDAGDAEKGLFQCDVEILLTIVRSRFINPPADWRVERMLEAERILHGYGLLKTFAAEMRTSDGHLGRLFKKRTGASFHTYVRDIRVSTAARLLRDRDLSLKTVSLELGYKQSSHLIRDLRQVLKALPSSLRSRHTAY